MTTLDLDWRIRLAAFSHVAELRSKRDGAVTRADLAAGFVFEGDRIPLFSAQRGIWRPKQIGAHGAALTIVTTPPKPGRAPPYDDEIASDDALLHYRYERGGPDVWTNIAVRNALVLQRPLIYLYGIGPGRYEPIFPCYVVGDRQADETFEISAAPAGASVLSFDAASVQTEIAREYATAAVKVRLHQRRFRELVVSAYDDRCTICSLGHRELLDGAHILEDRDERGRPEISNGLSLCKIHHGAYDANILGIAPDYRIVIRNDILEEHDGPMLRHGLQEMHGSMINVPRAAKLRPNAGYLEERFSKFRAA